MNNDTIRNCDISLDCSRKYQKIDGFGVNINSKYWKNGELAPVIDLLVDDLGATLFRLDAYGKSNWVDPENQFDESILNEETYKKVYNGIEFKNAAGMCKYLNRKGIEPFLTLSGVVPKWMCAEDGETLKNYEQFSEMAVSYLRWAKEKAKIRFTLFSPLNETNCGAPEGPKVSPAEFVKVIEALDKKMKKYRLDDIKLVVADSGYPDLSYFEPIFKVKKLKERIGVFGMHTYESLSLENVVKAMRDSFHKDRSIWMTEYGDMDQTGDREWSVSWLIFERLMSCLKDGVNGALNWDAYDNYHDHDEAWTVYGLIHKAGKNIHVPKKRYYAVRQAYRFIRPGSNRVSAAYQYEELNVLGFTSGNNKDFTITGMNKSMQDIRIYLYVFGLDKHPKNVKGKLYYTNASNNCVLAASAGTGSMHWKDGYQAIEMIVPSESIFTFTTVD